MTQLRDIIKTEGIIKISPEESLSSAVSKLRTSHDAAFVFNDKKKSYDIMKKLISLSGFIFII